MKEIIIILWAALFTGSLSAQISPIDELLDHYLEVKNALVKGDHKLASAKADQLATLLLSYDTVEQDALTLNRFIKTKDLLIKEAKSIASAKDIEKQRLALGELSSHVWALVNISKSVSRTIYYNFCPMKKMYWLSEEAAINNPFYGKSMLSCGKIEDQNID